MSNVARITQRTNSSGIDPAANRVLVRPDEIETQVTSENIELPEWVVQKYEQGQATGVLVATGPDAFTHIVERAYDRSGQLIEKRYKGYSEPFAEIGDRIAFAKYTGLRVRGEDKVKYLILNDEDITARVSAGVEFTDLDTRKGLGVK
jgi:co-chaperonin GroES (HSP10)